MTIAHEMDLNTLEPESPCPIAGCQTHGVGPELRAALAEASAAVGLAVVRAMTWCAWADDEGADCNMVHGDVLREVREFGLNVSDELVSSEVLGVADVYDSSRRECPPAPLT